MKENLKYLIALSIVFSMTSFANPNYEKITFDIAPTDEFSSFGKGATITNIKYDGVPIILQRNYIDFKWLCERAGYKGEPAAMASIDRNASTEDLTISLSNGESIVMEATGLQVAIISIDQGSIGVVDVQEGTPLRFPVSFGCRE